MVVADFILRQPQEDGTMSPSFYKWRKRDLGPRICPCANKCQSRSLNPALPTLTTRLSCPYWGLRKWLSKLCLHQHHIAGGSLFNIRIPGSHFLYQCHVNMLLKQAFLGFVVFRRHWAVVIAQPVSVMTLILFPQIVFIKDCRNLIVFNKHISNRY